MRELKFRVWNGYSTKEYKAYDRCHITMDGPYLEIEPYRYDNNYAIEQYTGLKDKNGKEIYEGDILRLYDRFVSVITWDTAAASFQWFATDGDGYCRLSELDKDYYKVIGNIHENPELLEGEEC